MLQALCHDEGAERYDTVAILACVVDQVLGERHPRMISSLANLAELYRSQGRYGEAEPLLKQALQLNREVLGERHPSTLISLNNLALLYVSQGRYGEAELSGLRNLAAAFSAWKTAANRRISNGCS